MDISTAKQQTYLIRMPGTVTEAKSTPWTVAEQFVQERIRLKQSNSRIALALRNAKIHRPALYMSAKKSFERALERAEINTVNGNPSKKVSKTKTNIADCKQKRFPQNEKNSSRIAQQSCLSDSVGKALSSRNDSTKLTNSCQMALDTAKSENPLGKSCNVARVDKSDNTIALKTVNVRPWENDVIKSASVGPVQGDAERERRIDRNISRLMELLQECNEHRHNDIRSYSSGRQYGNGKQSCQDDSDAVEDANQKLIKPEGAFPRSEGVDDGCLSGVLMASSKMPPNPWCFHQLPPIDKVVQQGMKRTFSSYRLPALRKDCHVCSECRRQTVEKTSRDHDIQMESGQLQRLTRSLELKERAYLEKEPSIIYEKAPASKLVQGDMYSSDLEHQTGAKLYLSHHSTNVDNHQKARKTKTNDFVSSIRTSDMCSSGKKQPCYKLANMEQMNSTNL